MKITLKSARYICTTRVDETALLFDRGEGVSIAKTLLLSTAVRFTSIYSSPSAKDSESKKKKNWTANLF